MNISSARARQIARDAIDLFEKYTNEGMTRDAAKEAAEYAAIEDLEQSE